MVNLHINTRLPWQHYKRWTKCPPFNRVIFYQSDVFSFHDYLSGSHRQTVFPFHHREFSTNRHRNEFPLHYNAVFLPITTKTAFPFSRPKSTLAQRLLFYVVGQTVFTEMKPGHAKINILKRILECPIWSRNEHCGKKWFLYYNNMK